MIFGVIEPAVDAFVGGSNGQSNGDPISVFDSCITTSSMIL